MSKSLSSIKNSSEKIATINRRVREQKGGLGYLSAKEAQKKMGLKEN